MLRNPINFSFYNFYQLQASLLILVNPRAAEHVSLQHHSTKFRRNDVEQRKMQVYGIRSTRDLLPDTENGLKFLWKQCQDSAATSQNVRISSV